MLQLESLSSWAVVVSCWACFNCIFRVQVDRFTLDDLWDYSLAQEDQGEILKQF